jgi:hypothetical protein
MRRVGRVLARGVAVLLGVLVLLLLWGAAIEPRFIIDTEQQQAPVRHLRFWFSTCPMAHCSITAQRNPRMLAPTVSPLLGLKLGAAPPLAAPD